jgi:DNA-binding response OmpR family regulator
MPIALTKPLNSLEGVTAMIVEDNMLVADSMRLVLESWDCRVAGMAGTVERAASLAAAADYDVAILDIDLRGSSVLPVVAVVRQQGKPFFFVSGYGDETVLPPDLRSVRRLNKPVDPDLLVRTIRTVLDDA